MISLKQYFVGILLLCALMPCLAFATGNTTDIVTLFMLFISIIAAALQATIVGVLLAMKLFKHQWLVTVSFIVSGVNLLFFIISISSLGQFGEADLSVWITITVVLVASPALIIMTFITPTRQYKKMQENNEI